VPSPLPNRVHDLLYARHRRSLWSLAALVAVVVLGTSGYVFLEHWSWFDALYMTIIVGTSEHCARFVREASS